MHKYLLYYYINNEGSYTCIICKCRLTATATSIIILNIYCINYVIFRLNLFLLHVTALQGNIGQHKFQNVVKSVLLHSSGNTYFHPDQ